MAVPLTTGCEGDDSQVLCRGAKCGPIPCGGGASKCSPHPPAELTVPVLNCDPGRLTAAPASVFAAVPRSAISPPAPGDFLRTTLDGREFTFNTELSATPAAPGASTGPATARAMGQNGYVEITVPSLENGTYSCPQARLHYSNRSAGPTELQEWVSTSCCEVRVRRVGNTVTGTFAGMVVGPFGQRDAEQRIQVTGGTFTITSR